MPRKVRRKRFCLQGHDTGKLGTRKDNSCSECRRIRHRAHYRVNSKKIRVRQMRYHRKILYGISQEEYEALLVKYKNRCAICSKPPTKKALAIDHEHGTGKIRGLLCFRCNIMIGMADDDVKLLQAGIDYLGL